MGKRDIIPGTIKKEREKSVGDIFQEEKITMKKMNRKSLIRVNLVLVAALIAGLVFSASNVGAKSRQKKDTKKVLVVYFSATGTTKNAAKKVKKATGGNLYQIKAAQQYTDADLDYTNDDSRANKEQNDESIRPKTKGKVKNIRKYDVIFIGFPIWHGKEPMIIRTFLESYNLKGKKIVPFCTSGGSGISGSMKGISASAKGANVVEGKDLTNASARSVASWAKKKMK